MTGASADRRGVARGIFAASLAACGVEQAFASKMRAGPSGKPYAFALEGDGEVDLAGVERVVVVAMGKGATPMLQSLLDRVRLPDGCEVSGMLIAPERPDGLRDGIAYFAGGHPMPNEESFAAARAALAMVREASVAAEKTFCFFLISGGASAMMELPLDESISLEETVGFYRVLVHSGAHIAEINCVRKHFSAVKGGRLGMAAAGMPGVTMLVSDVPEGQLDALASGPTLPDRSTVEQCWEILGRYQLLDRFPAAVRGFFESGQMIETPKPEMFSPRVFTLLSAEDLAVAARREAEALGFATVVDNTCDDWDYRDAADYLLGRLQELRETLGRVCLISTGEVTVKVTHTDGETGGKGGRNQHFALYAATKIAGSERPTVVFSAGSDGVDGNSDRAGAVVDETTLPGLESEAEDALRRFDSYGLLHRLNATVYTGPTGNNLRDLRLLIAE
ncbi:glycerate kinase type-2 family protein [Granulicella sibirica]|uniref:D-glycerate 2-kinase n=1 Tax=Granulicella sibirica TaxID=2479048 RepID=A0A4Q0T3W0_9BACT|nr:DUF4147 domain-containing protein [Granulicella sibirica]RXH58313.1 D-glycerate 2-kinase [Granulicella sibirica]